MNVTADVPTHFHSSATRPGAIGLLRESVRDISSRRRLIGYLVQADLRKKGSDTVLGNVWWVLDPLLQMMVYVIVVSVIFDRGGPDYPLFVFAAILPWKWFQSSITDGVTSVTGQDQLIRQIKFPKLVLPVSSVVSGIANFAFGLIPLISLALLFYRDRLTLAILLMPAIAAVQFVFTLGVTIALASMNVFYRDIGNVARHFLRLWFYLSPALYTIDQLRHATASIPLLGRILLLNPWATLFTAYHDVIFFGVPPDWKALGIVLLGSVAFLAIAAWLFKRLEPSFAKVL